MLQKNRDSHSAVDPQNQPARSPIVWNRLLKWLVPVLLAVGAGVVLLPLGMIFLTSFASIGVTPSLAPWQKGWSWENYQEAWERVNFLLAFANSTVVALAVTGFQVFTSALAGYAKA